MDVNSLLKRKKTISEIFSPLDEEPSSEFKKECYSKTDERVEDTVPRSLSTLSIFPVLKEITDTERKTAELIEEWETQKLLDGYITLQRSGAELLKLVENISSDLQNLHTSSLPIEQTLKEPTLEEGLPLPQELHRNAVKMIECCVWLIKHKKWQPSDYQVSWGNLIPKLQEELKIWEAYSKRSANHMKEIQDFKEKIDLVLQHLSCSKDV